ncbi:MAG: hypothetical protein IJR88_00415 [Clostridia bacterium]|nr:hypothetical protein [Clostridia bacterium]
MENRLSIEEQLKKEGFFVSTTAGYSMWPMLRNRRDRVIIRAYAENETPKINDLALYHRSDGKYVLHRILWVKPTHCIARGDNTFFLEKVKYKTILGRVTEFYRNDKHHTTDSFLYRLYVWAWRILFPARFVCHACKMIFHKLLSRAKRLVKKIIKKK